MSLHQDRQDLSSPFVAEPSPSSIDWFKNSANAPEILKKGKEAMDNSLLAQFNAGRVATQANPGQVEASPLQLMPPREHI